MKMHMEPYQRSFISELLSALLISVLLTACSAGGQKHTEMTTLVYAVLSEEGVHRSSVDRFNRTHKKDGVCIEIQEYFDEDGRSGKDRLLTEMASGKIPDIIDLGNGEYGMSYQQLVRKGYLEDLWPYINSDPDLNNGQLFEAPLKAAEVNGGLYTVFNEVKVNTLVGEERIVGNRYTWNLSELQASFASMPDESTVLEYYLTKSEMFPYVFQMSLDSYLDWETGEDRFDSDSFRAALEFVNSFPDTFSSLNFEGGRQKAMEVAEERVRYGQQMLSMHDIANVAWVQALDKVYGRGEKVAFVGYPTEDGSAGSAFVIQGRKLSMSSTCRDKEAAWEFLREMLLPRFRNPKGAVMSTQGISLNLIDYNLQKDWSTKPLDWYGGNHFDFFIDYTSDNFLSLIKEREASGVKVRRVTPTEAERYEDFISHVEKIDLYDTDLYDIVYEACGPYLSGDRSMEDTIRNIQNKVKIYWNENR